MMLVDAALDAARSGISILPWAYVGGSKKPMMRWKALQQKRMTPSEVEDWWRENPDHNVGAITGAISNLVIVDLDDKAALDWADNSDLPETNWKIKTGRGEHWGYQHPGGIIGNRTGIGGLNVDLRGDGGWAAIPPSIHKNNQPYKWASPLECMPFPENLPVFNPDWLPASPRVNVEIPVVDKNLLGNSTDVRVKRARAYLKARPGAIEGCGGDPHTYITCATILRDLNVEPGIAYELLAEWNMKCQPPWSSKALKEKMRNALSHGTKPFGSMPDRPSRPKYVENDDSFYAELEKPVKLYEDNDLGNGERYADRHSSRVRYCYEFNGWYYWDSNKWSIDRVGFSMSMAKITAREIAREATILESEEDRKNKNKWSLKSRSSASLKNMLHLAQSEGNIPVMAESFDSDAWVLNTPTGMVDLRTGDMSSHDPDKLCTKMTQAGINSTMATPNFDHFMDKTFGGDEDLKKYVMQALGFSLTGSVREHVFFFCYGTGANGKGTLLNLVMEMMGDYAAATPEGLLMARQGDKHLAELIILKGLRMAVGAETQEDRRLNEARMKNLTGGDPITADPKGGAYITFKPTHSLWLLGNHKPRIKGVDNGVWRRTRLIPFDNIVPDDEQDKDLNKKLWAERDGILAKLVDAAVDWYANGFVKCDAVERATNAYRNEEDAFGQFIDNMCVTGPTEACAKVALREAYLEWVRRSGVRELTERSMNERVKRLGYREIRRGTQRYWSGLNIQGSSEIH